MNGNKRDWNSILPWLAPIIISVLVIIFGVTSFYMTTKSVDAATIYTDRAIAAAPYFFEVDGKVLEARIDANEARFERIEKRLDQIFEKLNK